jgi:hypothetical protein
MNTGQRGRKLCFEFDFLVFMDLDRRLAAYRGGV